MQAQITNENLPKSMRYGLTGSTAVAATSQMSRFASVNGNSYTPTGANEVRIRVKANGFLDVKHHFLQFTVLVAAVDSSVDTHAGSFFDRITIEANGAIVEQINSYGLYNSIRKNYNRSLDDVNRDDVQSGGSQLSTKSAVGVFPLPSGTAAADVKAAADLFVTASTNLVLQTGLGSQGASIATGETHIFTIQLESGLFKNHHEKALPDGLTELELVLRLAGNKQALVTAAGDPTYTMSEVSFNAPTYQIQDAGIMAEYRAAVADEGVMISGDTAKTYINSIAASTGTKTLQINDRSISCKALVTAIRPSGADNTVNKYANGSYGFTSNVAEQQLESYKYIIAGTNYPNNDIKINTLANGRNLGRVFEESCKALSKHGETYCNTMVNKLMITNSFNLTNAASPATNSLDVPRGLVCVDLKKFSDDGLRMVGLNTSQNSSPNVLELNIPTNAMVAAEATTFSIVEAFYKMDGLGGLSVVM